MPITFADCADPMLRVPAMQATVAAALLTLGLVRPSQDASAGALWRAVCDWDWVDQAVPGRPTLRVRRIGLKARARRGDGSLMIGVELAGAHWRIACQAAAERDRATLAGMLGQLALSLEERRLLRALLFRAAGAVPSDWAAGVPRGVGRVQPRIIPADMRTAPLMAGAPL